jgi:hypothetical protein
MIGSVIWNLAPNASQDTATLIALEFTNYQKRIEELEKDLMDVCGYTMHLAWCDTSVPIINLKCNCGASDLHERIKSHLAKGVKG